MVPCSSTVAKGWNEVVGESRDVDKDIEPMGLGNLEVRSEGDSKDDIHAPRAGTQDILRESFLKESALRSCAGGSGWTSPPLSFISHFPAKPSIPLPTFPVFLSWEAPYPPTSASVLRS